MKLFKKLYFLIFTIPVLLLSCGGDDNETIKYSVVGKWDTQSIYLHTNLPESNIFDRNINGLYKQRLTKYTITRNFEEITGGNNLGRLFISMLDKENPSSETSQNETYYIKGDTIYITDKNLGSQTVPVFFNLTEDHLITRHKVEKTETKDDITPMMTDLGIVPGDDDPPLGTTGIVTMQFKRIKE